MCLLLALHTGTSFVVTLRQGFALSMTADGALLALAPLFVVAVEFSLVLRAAARRHVVHRVPVGSPRAPPGARGRPRLVDQTPEPPLVLRPPHRATRDRRTARRYRCTSRCSTSTGSRRSTIVSATRSATRCSRVSPSVSNGRCPRVPSPPASAGTSSRSSFPGAADMHATKLLAFDLHNRLCRPLVVNGFPLSVSMSIGLAFAPHHGEASTDLLAAADIAMYRAKRFRTSVELYQTSSSSRERGRIGLLADLSIAIDERPARRPLPAATRHGDRTHRHGRGPAAVAPPSSRTGAARRVHRTRRADRTDRTAHRMRAAAGDERAVDAPRSRRQAGRQHLGSQPARPSLRRHGDARARRDPVPGQPLGARGDRASARHRDRAQPVHHRGVARVEDPDRDRRLRHRLLVVHHAARRARRSPQDRPHVHHRHPAPPRGPAHREERHRARPRPRTPGRRRRRRDRRTSGGSSAISVATSPRATASRCRCRSSICGPGSPSARSDTRRRSSRDPRVGHVHRRRRRPCSHRPACDASPSSRSATCGSSGWRSSCSWCCSSTSASGSRCRCRTRSTSRRTRWP